MPKSGYVYILASERNGTLYVGVTNDLVRRVQEHHAERNPGSFTARYDVKRLVYYEYLDDIRDAITREKRIKGWKRHWKLELIEGMNLHWRDLYADIAPASLTKDASDEQAEPFSEETSLIRDRSSENKAP